MILESNAGTGPECASVNYLKAVVGVLVNLIGVIEFFYGEVGSAASVKEHEGTGNTGRTQERNDSQVCLVPYGCGEPYAVEYPVPVIVAVDGGGDELELGFVNGTLYGNGSAVGFFLYPVSFKVVVYAGAVASVFPSAYGNAFAGGKPVVAYGKGFVGFTHNVNPEVGNLGIGGGEYKVDIRNLFKAYAFSGILFNGGFDSALSIAEHGNGQRNNNGENQCKKSFCVFHFAFTSSMVSLINISGMNAAWIAAAAA